MKKNLAREKQPIMKKFFIAHKDDLLFIGFTLLTVILLLWLTQFTYTFLNKKLQAKFSRKSLKSLLRVKQILNTLWVIIGLGTMSFVFLNQETVDKVKDQLELIVYVGVIIILTILFAAVMQLFFSKQIQEKINEGEDSTNLRFIQYLATIAVYSLGLLLIILAFPSLRTLAGTILGGAGILAVVIGIASQEALANLVSGIFIITFKPFKIGDIVKITDEMMGTVHDITLRHTVIRDFQNKMIVIPNAIINKERLINYDLNDNKVRQWVFIRISYDSDLDLAKKIMYEESMNHPFTIDNRSPLEKANKEPVVLVKVVELQESCVMLRAWVWTNNYENSFDLKCDLYESIKKRFDTEGIVMPFPHRMLVFKDENAQEYYDTTNSKEDSKTNE